MATNDYNTTASTIRRFLRSVPKRFLRHTAGSVTIEYTLLMMLVGVTMAGAFSMVANSRVDQTIAELREILAPVNDNPTILVDDKNSTGVDNTILTGSTGNSDAERDE